MRVNSSQRLKIYKKINVEWHGSYTHEIMQESNVVMYNCPSTVYGHPSLDFFTYLLLVRQRFVQFVSGFVVPYSITNTKMNNYI